MQDSVQAPPNGSPFEAVEAFRVALSVGDGKGVEAAHTDGDVTILDNVAPFIWSGPAAVATWLADMAAYARHRGLSDQNVIYGAAISELIDGDAAYGIYPAEWTYLEHGTPRRDKATIAFALRYTPRGWKIAGWSWNPKP